MAHQTTDVGKYPVGTKLVVVKADWFMIQEGWTVGTKCVVRYMSPNSLAPGWLCDSPEVTGLMRVVDEEVAQRLDGDA